MKKSFEELLDVKNPTIALKEYEYMSNMITNCIVDNFCSDYYTKTEDNNDR